MSSIALAAAAVAVFAPAASAITNYAADFVAPDYVVNFQYPANTVSAQQTIISWANERAKGGPWSVTNKPFAAPSGDMHDYLSMAPYYWPNCAGVGNTTVLTIPEMQKQCQYENQDGNLNPDARLVNNIGDFDDLADAVLYNSLAWGITRDSTFSQRVASFIDTWFLNENTFMNPNLNYAQLRGGPDGQTGAHTGLLDLKSMSKIASGILTLRQGNADGWNATIDDRFKEWVTQYIGWATSAPMALEEKAAENNHGSFYYTQLASLHVLNNDKASAAATVQEYFDGIYKGQIDADGNQPLEHTRTRPYHYLAYNLVAMMTNLRIGLYAGYDGSAQVTTNGGTIPKAAEYAMAFPPADETASELFPPIQAVGAVYGDPDGKYAAWLNEKSAGDYVKDAAYFWNQPLGDSGVQQLAYVTYQGTSGPATVSPGTQPTGGVNAEGVPTPGMEVGATGASAGADGSPAGPAETGAAAPKSSAGRRAAPLGAVLVAGALALFL